MGGVFDERLAMHGSSTANDAQAFVLAFRDTYIVAGILSALAVAVSITYWPRVILRRTRSKN